MAYTYAILDVSAECFREIQNKLEAAGYQHAFKEGDDGQLLIDMHGVALRDEESEADTEAIGHPLARPDDGHGKQGRSS